MAILKSDSFEVEGQKVAAIQKEIQELSSEAELALKEYFAYILSIPNRKSSASPLAGNSCISPISK